MRIPTLIVLTTLLAPLQAQSASFTSYGTGCGSGGQGCISANWGNPFAGNRGSNANFALPFNTGSTVRVACGIELYCKTNSGQPANMYVAIWSRHSSTGTPDKELAKAVMPVTGTAQAHRASFSAPQILPASTDYFIVFDNSVNLNLPLATTGANNVHYFGSVGSWRGPFRSARWMYQLICCGGSTPSIGNTQLPKLGQSFSIDLRSAPTSAAGFLAAGLGRLKIDLGPAGAPGCFLYTNPVILLPIKTTATGTFALKVAVPNNPQLAGNKLNCQYAIQDSSANRFGLVFSQGGEAVAGT